jgi:flagellar motor component MotA
MKKSYFIYAPLTLGLFIWGILIAGGNLLWFFDLPSVILIVCPLLFLLLAVFGPRAIVDSFRAAMESVEATRFELKRAILFFATAQKIFLLAGVIATMAGVIMTLYGLSRSNLGSIYYIYITVAFLTVFYSFFLMLIVTVPFRAALEQKLYRIEEGE